MKKTLNLTIAVGMILALGACSSSRTTENGENVDPAAAPATDAATDAVPQPDPEAAALAQADPAAVPPPAADPLAALAPPPVAPGPVPTAAAAAPSNSPTTQAKADPVAVEPSPAGNGSFDDYTVQAGDTLMKVAFETYGDLYRWKGILDANKDKVTDPNRIPAGTVLKLEKPSTPVTISKNGDKYMIKSGDTLGTISHDVYGTKSKWKVLWENNKQLIHDPNRIFAGFYLYYEPDTNATPQPLAQAPAAKAVDTARAPAAAAPAALAPAPAALDVPPPAQITPAVPGPDVGAAPAAPVTGG